MLEKNYYMYHSSSYWDKTLKKLRKISKYLGILDLDKKHIKSGGRHRIYLSDIKNIMGYSNLMLMYETSKNIKPLLKENFSGCWVEICAITMGNVPLKRIKDT